MTPYIVMIFVTFSSKTDIFYYRDTGVSRLVLWFCCHCCVWSDKTKKTLNSNENIVFKHKESKVMKSTDDLNIESTQHTNTCCVFWSFCIRSFCKFNVCPGYLIYVGVPLWTKRELHWYQGIFPSRLHML